MKIIIEGESSKVSAIVTLLKGFGVAITDEDGTSLIAKKPTPQIPLIEESLEEGHDLLPNETEDNSDEESNTEKENSKEDKKQNKRKK